LYIFEILLSKRLVLEKTLLKMGAWRPLHLKKVSISIKFNILSAKGQNAQIGLFHPKSSCIFIPEELICPSTKARERGGQINYEFDGDISLDI
jgi:hypothetical protein